MAKEADLSINLRDATLSVDFDAIADISMNDFSGLNYLLFKHGSLL